MVLRVTNVDQNLVKALIALLDNHIRHGAVATKLYDNPRESHSVLCDNVLTETVSLHTFYGDFFGIQSEISKVDIRLSQLESIDPSVSQDRIRCSSEVERLMEELMSARIATITV